MEKLKREFNSTDYFSVVKSRNFILPSVGIVRKRVDRLSEKNEQ